MRALLNSGDRGNGTGYLVQLFVLLTSAYIFYTVLHKGIALASEHCHTKVRLKGKHQETRRVLLEPREQGEGHELGRF